MNRSIAMVALTCIGLATLGCYKPSGKKGVLYFGLEMPQGAGNGLAQDVLMPEKLLAANFAADFTGTSMRASGPGLVIQETTQLPNDAWRLRVLCDPTSSQTVRELSVQIVAGDSTRYADATDLTCLDSYGLEIYPTDVSQWILGSTITISTTLDAKDASGSTVQAQGHGWTTSSGGAVTIADWNFAGGNLDLTAVQVGTSPVLSAGTVQATLPITVVDDAAWSLTLTATRTPIAGDTTTVGVFVTAQAAPASVSGLANCAFTITNGTSVLVTTNEAYCTGYYEVPASAAGQICASAFGHSACQPYGP